MLERIKTALVLLVIVCFCLFATKNPTPMVMLMTVGGILAAYEWANLIPELGNKYVFVALVVLGNFACFLLPNILTFVWVLACAVWVFAAFWVKRYPKQAAQWFSKYVLVYAGVVLIVATMSSMFYLWQQSPWWLLYAMGLVWCADTGAYFAGRAFGKHKLAPNVSPKKTYAGLVGGLLLCAVVILLVSSKLLNLPEASWQGFVLLSMLAAAMSVLGDLFESMIKRKAGVKDSGKLLPGHGGLLDRIDSMMATLPVFALGFMAVLGSNG